MKHGGRGGEGVSSQCFATLPIGGDAARGARGARSGKRTVCPKNVPSVINVFNDVSTAYHSVPGLPQGGSGGDESCPQGQKPLQPSWRKPESAAPAQLHHPHRGDLLHSQPEPEPDRELQQLIDKVEALESRVAGYDYNILQGEWEIQNMRAQRSNIRLLKHGAAPRDDAPIAAQHIPRGSGGNAANTLVRRCAAVVMRPADGAAPAAQHGPLIAAARGMRFGKRMRMLQGCPVAPPFNTDADTTHCPRKTLNAIRMPPARAVLEAYVARSAERYNKGVFVDGAARKLPAPPQLPVASGESSSVPE